MLINFYKNIYSFKSTRSRWKDTSEEDDDSEEEDSDAPAPKRVKKAPVRKATSNNKRHKKKSYSSDDSTQDDRQQRNIAARRGKQAVSYKEASEDDRTGSEDLIDMEYNEEMLAIDAAAINPEDDNTETIEKIVGKRIGKKGVTGNETTCYAVEEKGDPNAGVDVKDKGNIENQFLIKWKDWSHIHNTWESAESLERAKVKGLKKLENFMKREHDVDSWKRHAGPEDIDYFECQQELHQELLKSYNNVERIIAEQVNILVHFSYNKINKSFAG